MYLHDRLIGCPVFNINLQSEHLNKKLIKETHSWDWQNERIWIWSNREDLEIGYCKFLYSFRGELRAHLKLALYILTFHLYKRSGAKWKMQKDCLSVGM